MLKRCSVKSIQLFRCLSQAKAGFRNYTSQSSTSKKTFEEINSEYNIFINHRADPVKTKEPKETSKKLSGVSISIKDNLLYPEFPTTAASSTLSKYQPPTQASCISKLVAEGAYILGKTNLDEFGMGSLTFNSKFGPTFNPNYPPSSKVSSGGSSGGSASSIASKLCYASIGTDTGGSVRLPAAYTEVVGFKPSYGVISRYGVIPYASSLDTVGILADRVERVEKVFQVIRGQDKKDWTSVQLPATEPIENRRIKVGIVKQFFVEEMDKDIERVWRNTIKVLKSKGVELVSVDLINLMHCLPTYYVIALAEASSNLAKFDGYQLGSTSNNYNVAQLRGHHFSQEVQKRIVLGTLALSKREKGTHYQKASKLRNLLCLEMDLLFKQVDFLLSPTNLNLPPTFQDTNTQNHLDTYLMDLFTVPASLTGIPAISIPATKNRSPNEIRGVGIQLMANRFNDLNLLKFANQVEQWI